MNIFHSQTQGLSSNLQVPPVSPFDILLHFKTSLKKHAGEDAHVHPEQLQPGACGEAGAGACFLPCPLEVQALPCNKVHQPASFLCKVMCEILLWVTRAGKSQGRVLTPTPAEESQREEKALEKTLSRHPFAAKPNKILIQLPRRRLKPTGCGNPKPHRSGSCHPHDLSLRLHFKKSFSNLPLWISTTKEVKTKQNHLYLKIAL